MKALKLNQICLSVFLSTIMLLMATDLVAQKKARTRVRAYYEKLVNDNKQIKVILTSGSGKNMQGIAGADIEIFNTVGDEDKSLAIVQTNSDGEGFLQIEGGYPLDKDEDGFARLSAKFFGNDTLRSANRNLKFKDLQLELQLAIEDSVKFVRVLASEDSAGVRLPVEEIDIEIGVQRLLSVLPLEKVETNKKGLAEYEFPNDLPGDNEGSLKIIVRVFEDRNYGTVNKEENIKWGTIVDYSIAGNGRSLYGDEAPRWMIIAVFIVLGGAWFHFIWAILKVWKIKKLGREA
jgi:hypothetical protein